MRKIKRKGEGNFLTDNALSIIIAILGIALIVFGLFKLYYTFIDDEYKNVGNTLENIEGKANALKEGEGNEFLIPGFPGLEKWTFVGWDSKDPMRPDKCFFESCICLCNTGNLFEVDVELSSVGKAYFDDQDRLELLRSISNKCNSDGICKKISSEDVKVYSIDSSMDTYSGVKVDIEYPFISLDEGANLISISKDKNGDLIFKSIKK